VKPPIWFSAGLIAASVTTATATPQNTSRGLSPAERWVVAQVTAGEIADLSKKFPKEKDRKLSAHFLENLLTGTLPGVKLHRHGVRIIGATIDEPVDLENTQIPCEAWLEHCQFNASATFDGASFTGAISFDNSAFKAEASFNGMKVGSVASFNDAVFQGPVDFVVADIVSEFHMDGAKFKAEASFNGMKVGGVALFNDAVFEGPVHFVGADIVSLFDMDGAKFQNKEKTVDFNTMKIGGAALFNDAVFEGPVVFDLANIASNFVADEAQFQNKEQGISFNSMKVGHTASFEDAMFEGPVVFGLANIAGGFVAAGAKFQNKENKAIFSGMKVGDFAFFDEAVFEGPVDFISADIAGQFRAIGAKFRSEANFNSMKVGGAAFFNDAVFERWVDLSYADFVALSLVNTVWPKIAGQFHMQGMSYKYIRAVREDEPKSHKELLKLADQSAYTADVYSNLEEFFKRQGYRADADRAFIAGKCRERKQYFHSDDWFRWLGSWTLYLLVGYGRRPWQAGISCAVLVALGCILFSPAKMELQDPKELQKPEEMRHQYNRFWYSLGLFLPVVDLKSSELWKPMKKHPFLRNYVRVHILLGWILIPLVLAALTGLIK
jgi:uncharacterized protein YjbI with pentapeptide repeats